MNKGMKALAWAGYALFFVVALVFFVRVTFPTDQIKEIAKSKIAERLKAERVEIADLGITGLWPSGVKMTGLEIELPALKVKTPERGVDVLGGPRLLSVEELAVHGDLLGLRQQNLDLEIDGKIQGGELHVPKLVYKKGEPLAFELAEMKGIELGTEGLFQTLTGFDITATLGGHAKLDVPSAGKEDSHELDLSQVAGELVLELSDAKIAQPIIDTVMQKEPVRMSFTDTSLGALTVRLVAEPGGAPAPADAKGPRAKKGEALVIQIQEVSATGGDIEIAVAPKATITLMPGQPLKEAIINLHLAVKIADGWFDIEVKDLKDPTKMTKPNVGVRTMLTMGPLKQHVQDGQFGVGITGPLGSPKVAVERPRTRVGAGGAATGGASRKMNVDHPGGDEGEGEGDEGEAPKSKASTRTTETAKARPVPTPDHNKMSRPALGRSAPANGVSPTGGGVTPNANGLPGGGLPGTVGVKRPRIVPPPGGIEPGGETGEGEVPPAPEPDPNVVAPETGEGEGGGEAPPPPEEPHE